MTAQLTHVSLFSTKTDRKLLDPATGWDVDTCLSHCLLHNLHKPVYENGKISASYKSKSSRKKKNSKSLKILKEHFIARQFRESPYFLFFIGFKNQHLIVQHQIGQKHFFVLGFLISFLF